MSGATSPDLEALVTVRIREAFQAAINQVGRNELLATLGIDDQILTDVLGGDDNYVPVGLVTLVCEINKTHKDLDPAHSSLTECLKGTTIRIPHTGVPSATSPPQRARGRRKLPKGGTVSASTGPLLDKPSMRLLGFGANIFTFLILGYFFGGVALSPLIGQPSCIGVALSPPSLSPCEGSLIGLVVAAIGGLGFTYYYFVKKL